MPKPRPAEPQHGPAIPLSGSFPTFLPPVAPSIPRVAVPTAAPRTALDALDAQKRADRVTTLCFQAFMVLNTLGLAAVGYALLTL